MRSRVPLLVAVLMTLAVAAPAQGAGTIVSGTAEDNTPLVIDPSSSPQDHLLWGSTPRVFFIQSMPTTKTVNSVTLGDLGVDASACGSTPTATVRVAVREAATGDLDTSESFTSSAQAQTLTTTPRRVTWSIPQKTFVQGRGYIFQLWIDSGCITLVQRTWRHADNNGSSLMTVNSGPALCTSGPPVGTNGASSTKRSWHNGGNVRRYPCVPETGGPFRPEIGTGWLISRYFSGYYDLIHAWSIDEDWADDHACDAGGGTSWETYGAEPVYGYEYYRYFCRWSQFGPPGSPMERGWYYAIPWRAPGFPRDMYLRLGPVTQDKPATFRPHLRYDGAETYRPLDVGAMQQEVFGDGTRHKSCFPNPTTCWDFDGDEDFTAADYIDIHGEGSADNYTTPASACLTGGLRECNGGSSSSIYYKETPGGFGTHYIDYWIFYRYNDWPGGGGSDHEGDWESVSVGMPSTNPQTFTYASFSQHGRWFSYLRGNLRCDGGGSGSCGTEEAKNGRRIDAFVANGSHAMYPEPCTADNCAVRSDHWAPGEGGHDGTAAWGNDDVRSALKPLNTAWTNWAGKWGREGGPNSPGWGGNAHLHTPWDFECANDNAGCNPGMRRLARPQLAAARQKQDARCDAWFGARVRAVACAPTQLSKATRRGGLRGAGAFRFDLSRAGRGVTASAPGLAQSVGDALPIGSQFVIRGKAPDGAVLLVRAQSRNEVVEARFTGLGLRRGGRGRIVVGASGGRPSLRLVRPDGTRVKPTAVNRVPKR